MGSIVPILAALFGALAAGGFKTAVDIFDRRRLKKATLTALATEVSAVCNLIRAQQYLETSREIEAAIETEEWQASPEVLVIDIRENYFTAYQALIGSIGLLEPNQAQAIVEFYSLCRSAIDAHRPDSVIPETGDKTSRTAHVRAGVVLFTRILELGDEISQFPSPAIETKTLRLIPRGALSTGEQLRPSNGRVLSSKSKSA